MRVGLAVQVPGSAVSWAPTLTESLPVLGVIVGRVSLVGALRTWLVAAEVATPLGSTLLSAVTVTRIVEPLSPSTRV